MNDHPGGRSFRGRDKKLPVQTDTVPPKEKWYCVFCQTKFDKEQKICPICEARDAKNKPPKCRLSRVK